MLTKYALSRFNYLHEDYIFQQDGAPPHFSTRVKSYLNNKQPGNWIGTGGPVTRLVRVLVATRYGMRCVAAGLRTRRLLHGCVAAGRRSTTHNRVETMRVRPIRFHLVQVPGVPVDTLERVTPKCEARR